jgi:hypothetical protein
MKNWQISALLGILILGFLLAGGCSSTVSPGTPSQPTTSTVTIATAPVPPTLVSTTAVPTTAMAFSTNEINKHFVDIAFDPDNAYINKWELDFVDIGISGAYTDADIIRLNNFTQLFNKYSSVELLEVKKDRVTANIVLRFMPESGLQAIETENSWKIYKNRETGDIIFVYTKTPDTPKSETIFINSDFKGDERTHWILRALLYGLGFHGESGNYPDSIFYSGSGTTTSLSKIDLKVVELMYGKKIYNGMDLTDVQELLLIDNE